MEEIVQLLNEASENRLTCRIRLHGEPIERVVHPYGVCCTPQNQIVLVCWQVMGFTKAGGKAGYRNLVLKNIESVEILDTKFKVDKNFNPTDAQYKEWVYHV